MQDAGSGVWVVFLLFQMVPDATASSPCSPKFFGSNAMVCVCNATYCDTIGPINLPPVGSYLKYVTSKAGLRLERSKGGFRPEHTGSGPLYTYNSDVRYQTVKGFGGSLTDSAAINIFRLSRTAQEHLLRSYFSEEGIEYSFLRTPMACSDFSTHPYSYNDNCIDDFELKCFSLAEEDTKLKPVGSSPALRSHREPALSLLCSNPQEIPLFHRIRALAKWPLSLIASPWTAPGWLRTNNNVMGKSFLKGEAGDKYHQTWAQYFIRFMEEYKRHNITFWAITSQNEPHLAQFATQPNFPTMTFSAEQQRDFIAADLGPALAKSPFNDTLLIILDDQRHLLPRWAQVVLGNSSVAQYVAGIGIHWYLDPVAPPCTTLQATHKRFPGFFLLYTEACNGYLPWQRKVDLGSWSRGSWYSQSILSVLNNYVTGWIDWNLALDMQGGPSWINNHVDSPIIVNPSRDEFYKQPKFYHLGHFSKFIPKGSVRVDLTSNRLIGTCCLTSSAFQRPDGIAVVVVLNSCWWNISIGIKDDQVGYLEDTIPSSSIQTYLWRRP